MNIYTNNINNRNSILEKHEKTIAVYTLGGGFFVEADKGPEVTDFYIYHERYGVKSLMFGLLNRDVHSEEAFILANAEDQIRFYCEEYMDADDEDIDI